MGRGPTRHRAPADRVYLSTDRGLARIWAGQWTDGDGRVGDGWLYRVRVDVDALEPDEDVLSLPGLSYQALMAVGSSVYARHQPAFAHKLQRVLHDLEQARQRAD